MRKVKKGSALLNVLMITMILTMTAGIITTAVVQTTKGNVYKKVTDDLTYAAESGVQQAISNIENSIYKGLALGGKERFNINTQFSTQDIKVDVEVVKNMDNATYNVTSVSSKIENGSTRERTVKAVIKKAFNGTFGNENLLKYNLCGQDMFLYGSGATAGQSGLVNGSDNLYAVDHWGSDPAPLEKESNKYLVPVFDNLPYAGEQVVVTSTGDLDNLVRTGKAMYKEYFAGAVQMNIYLVNTENLVWKYTSGFQLSNTILVTSGNFTVIHEEDYKISGLNLETGATDLIGIGKDGIPKKDASGKFIKPTPRYATATIQLSTSSIISNNSSFYAGDIHLAHPPYGTPWSPIQTTEQLKEIDNIIRKYASNWASENVVDGQESWSETEVSYE